MPPRKSNASVVSGTGDEAPPSSAKEKKEELGIEDFSMPRTMVQRLAKSVLPPNTQLQKDAITALSRSSTLFISHLASAAQGHTETASRRTMNPADVFAALRDIEYEGMIPQLEAELANFNELQAAKKSEYRKKAMRDPSTRPAEHAPQTAEAGVVGQSSTMEVDLDRERGAKRAKVSTGTAKTAAEQEVEADGDETEDAEDMEDQDEDEEEEAEEDEAENDDDEQDETSLLAQGSSKGIGNQNYDQNMMDPDDNSASPNSEASDNSD